MELRYLLADAWEELPKLQNDSVDLILTDPPYMEYESGTAKGDPKARTTIAGVFTPENMLDFAMEAYRLLKPGGHCYVFSHEKTICRDSKSLEAAGLTVLRWLIWVKTTFTRAGRFDLVYPQTNEFIIFAVKKDRDDRYRPLRGQVHGNVLSQFGRTSGSYQVHPTEKPVNLLAFLIEKSTEEGDLILDPFAGVCTTGIAAASLKRRFLGFEIVPEVHKRGEALLLSLGLSQINP
ncbi:MAG: site-specific DNA-methyltransferase [Candidatus Caldarchaeum sp.]